MKVLILAGYEICYNPRLIKAAEYFSEKCAEIIVINPVTGIATEEIYRDFIAKKSWKIIEIDISKRSVASYFRWLFVSLVNSFLLFLYKNLGVGISFSTLLTKSFLLLKLQKIPVHDLIITNLVTNLPMAAKIKRKFHSRLIYDSQEYFIGQYRQFHPLELKWVIKSENTCIDDADIVTATTKVLTDKLMEIYPHLNPIFRVRNAPLKAGRNDAADKASHGSYLELIWHGLSINYKSRGVHVLLDALKLCMKEIRLTLQGNITPFELERILLTAEELGISDRLSIREPAPPDAIVESIFKYDVGIIAELPIEENQILTSSNKLFDYIHAGLAVVSSDLPGLAETINEYKVGELYPAGNAKELASKLIFLYTNRNILDEYKRKSENARNLICWEKDYDPVYDYLSTINNKHTSSQQI
jgi:glycosyltransferase involved in cell wall biosynthesis